MGFLVSPGVDINEIDLTNVIPAVSTSIGGFAGHFRWGPVEQLVSVSSEKELAQIFGAPKQGVPYSSTSFLQAASFLKYGSELKIARAYNTDPDGDPLASPVIPAQLLNSSNVGGGGDYITDIDNVPADAGVYARYPGEMGDSLKVVMIDSNAAVDHPYAAFFDNPIPDAGEIHMLVIDEDGEFGAIDTNLEVWTNLSTTPGDKKEDGSANYYVEVLNQSSGYIWISQGTGTYDQVLSQAIDEEISPAATIDGVFEDSLENGLADNDNSAIVNALELFRDFETVDVNLLFAETGGEMASADEKTIHDTLISICEERKDCISFCSAPAGTEGVQLQNSEQNKLNTVVGYFSQFTSTSYAVLDSGVAYVYNKYLDTYNWIPTSGHVAGLCANTDDVAEPWFSPAGYNRGQLLGITKLAFNPKQAARDTLYKARINPVVSFPGQGTLLFGDKTALSKPSAFDRINVRRLFITLEKAIATAAKYQLFELNDEFTRAMFRNMTEPFMRDVKGRRGVTDFLVVCDETNNTGEVIDTNRFVADIYIKPARSINFITLNFIATRTGVEFSEIVGK